MVLVYINLFDQFSGSVDSVHVARRHRSSPYPIISVAEAVEKVLSHCDHVGTENVKYTGNKQQV